MIVNPCLFVGNAGSGGGTDSGETGGIGGIVASAYGVYWDGTENPAWTRTGASANFDDPVPYAAGADHYGSPFDFIMPWSGMKRVTDAEAGELVSIPKFWYKWTRDGDAIGLQISNTALDGFHVSPAHVDRGDGKGERDVVYVGRYASGSDYRSVTGQTPIGNLTISTARAGIAALGDSVWQFDYAMLMTIRMLYLVEFAHWNSQEKIGHGGGNGVTSPQPVGSSDAMPYHTGAMEADRTTSGLGVQYRYIEGLWENVFSWCDGIRISGSKVYGILNPAAFSDSAGGVQIGTTPSYLSKYDAVAQWSSPDAEGLEGWIYPSRLVSVSQEFDTYSCDTYSAYNTTEPAVYVGAYNYATGQGYGLFSCYSCSTDMFESGSKNVSCRVQKLP